MTEKVIKENNLRGEGKNKNLAIGSSRQVFIQILQNRS